MTCERTVAWPNSVATLSEAGFLRRLSSHVADRPGRIAIGSKNYGGDALRDLRFGQRIGVEAFGGWL